MSAQAVLGFGVVFLEQVVLGFGVGLEWLT